ncbi:MAG TPA: CRISPR-associated endonuclease Cas1 [Negativicutes bacterium]|nr:CRISPR-associated endonuclease Cas1 [Negativicutes bacterium]
MNAIWITRISAYKQTENCFVSAEKIMNIKNQRRELMLKKYGVLLPHIRLADYHNNQAIMLAEGRAAQLFWKQFSLPLPSWCGFRARMPGSDDIVNRLLDLGYHQITNVTRKILEKYDISPALGILHVARKSTSAPLAYDLVEMFRADIVETEVLKFLRMKKQPMEQLRQKDIPIFLYRINRRLARRHFIKSFKQCHTYLYYMELQILKFISAVNHKEVFSPIHLPSRHDGRCG